MRRILYIGNKLEKHGATPTGVDTLSKKLEAEGFQVKAVSSYKNKAFRLGHMVLSVLRNIQNKDLVLIDTYSTRNFWYAISCARICSKFSIPYIFILHGGNLQIRFENSSEEIIELFRRAKANVVPSEFLKEKLGKFNFENLWVIPNTLELSFYNFKKRTEISPSILWVRAFAEVYNPEMAIQVIKELLKKHPEAELCMVGPEKDGRRAKLERKVERENLPVKFTGKLDKEKWIEISKSYDIFINTTNVDNTPVSVLEAMALGLPVVSTRVGGIPYLIEDGNEGLLVKENDYIGMANCIENLIDDQELTDKISSNARRKVEKFDWDHVKSHWLELLG